MSALAELQRQFPIEWSMRRGYRLPTRELGEPYYIRWSGEPRPRGEGWNNLCLDDDGIIVTGAYRNPVTVSQFALTQYERAWSGDALARERFLRHARWIASEQDVTGSYRYPLPLALYDAPAGWLSGMAQGEAASVLLRAYALTRETPFLLAGKRALEPFLRDTRHGGVSYLRDGHVFFEEVATPDPCHILNGHLYAAFALWEYIEHDLVAEPYVSLHDRAVGTLLLWLEKFDHGGWSTYDLAYDSSGRSHSAPLHYHQFHIAQLRVYAAMTGNETFSRMAQRWHHALDDRRVRARVWKYGARLAARSIVRRLTLRPTVPFRP